ncbi:hypothetical protein DFS34DRAFT_640541 [Phlyctochytrium arcticum]|nr:hypothetical protein DFS34DRAFT_640541 [Phlyctochytrium arcticum]
MLSPWGLFLTLQNVSAIPHRLTHIMPRGVLPTRSFRPQWSSHHQSGATILQVQQSACIESVLGRLAIHGRRPSWLNIMRGLKVKIVACPTVRVHELTRAYRIYGSPRRGSHSVISL